MAANCVISTYRLGNATCVSRLQGIAESCNTLHARVGSVERRDCWWTRQARDSRLGCEQADCEMPKVQATECLPVCMWSVGSRSAQLPTSFCPVS